MHIYTYKGIYRHTQVINSQWCAVFYYMTVSKYIYQLNSRHIPVILEQL